MRTTAVLLISASWLSADPKPSIEPLLDTLPAEARVVQYGPRSIPALRARLRFTTMIELPAKERILDFVCGDKELWVVNGVANLAYVKPSKPGAKTNLVLVTASGNSYVFILQEGGDQPDLRVIVEPTQEMMDATNGALKFVPASAVEDYKQQAEMALISAHRARQDADKAITDAKTTAAKQTDQAAAQLPTKLKFAYRWKKDPLFAVSSIYHDGKFTYIAANPQETPAVYEYKDGKPNLVNAPYADGVFTFDKVLDSGYMKIGKKEMPFIREDTK